MKAFSLSALAVTLSALVACGGGDDSPGGTSSSDMNSSDSSSSVSSVSSSSSSSAPASSWEQVWADEFEGDSIDSQKWSFEVNCAGGGNNELQCYTDREENAYVEDGMLHIVARNETFSGPGVFDDDPSYDPNDTSVQRDYTSARLRTKGNASWKYGRIEMRAKMPQGQGLWPAFWMLPETDEYGGWPRSGEIDIFEAVNTNAAGGNETHGTLHYGAEWPGNVYSGESHTPSTNIWEEFHTYAVEWSEGEIHWFVDDVHFASQTSDGWYNYYWSDDSEGYKVGEGAAPFNQPFHLIMNVAVGGDWPGGPNAETQFPQTMTVDYVRVYECSEDPQSGQGCSENLDDSVEPLTGNPAPAVQTSTLYDGGAATLTMDGPDGTVENTLTPGQYQAAGGNLVADPAATDDGSTVWHGEFYGTANIFLTTDDMADTSGVDAGLNLASLQQTGELTFDIKVNSKAEAAEIAIKLDSGWPNVSFATIDPPVGEWVTRSIALSDLQDNNVEPGAVDWENVTNPFVLEVSGGEADIMLRNIEFNCLGNCGPEAILVGQSAAIEAPHAVFDDAVNVNWDFGIGTWDSGDGSHVTTSVVDAQSAERGKVIDVQFSSADSVNGLAFIQSTGTKDMTALAGGELSFDVRVMDYASASGLVTKADCVHPCTSGDIDIGMPGAGDTWETVTVAVDDFVNGGLDLTNVNTPFAIFPTWDSQANVHLQVDNIRYTAP